MAAPVLGGDRAITVPEGGTAAVTTADLSATDADSTDSELVYTVTGTSHGSVLKSGSATTSFTQADLAANFQHDGGELDGSFTVSLTDGSASPQSATVNATVNPHVNDAPVIDGDLELFLRRGELRFVSDHLSATDPDNGASELIYTVTAASHGTVMITQGPHNPNKAITMFSQAEIARVFFLHDGSDFDGSFTVSLTDGTAPPQTVTVDVEVSRPTDIITGFPLQVKEQSPANTDVGFVTGVERDNRGDFIYSLIDDAGGRFVIGSGGAIWVGNPLLDFETSASHTIIVRVTNLTGFSFDKAFTIAVLDVSPDILTGGHRARHACWRSDRGHHQRVRRRRRADRRRRQ